MIWALIIPDATQTTAISHHGSFLYPNLSFLPLGRIYRFGHDIIFYCFTKMNALCKSRCLMLNVIVALSCGNNPLRGYVRFQGKASIFLEAIPDFH
jgi:hypothetical protein